VYTGDVSGVCSALYELGGMVVIHDPSGCNSTYNTHDETRWYDQDSLIYISGLCERDAILGNDDKFLRDVTAAAKELAPSFIALTNSPIPFMNGTDFEALARVIEKRTGIPAFYVRANGMHDYTVGAGNAFAKLADYMRTEAGDLRTPADRRIQVNILGLTPLDFDAPHSLERLTGFLQSGGCSVNVCLGMGAKTSDWRRAPEADVNLVVSSTGLPLAERMEELYGIPYAAGIPTGAFREVLSERLEGAAATRKSVVAYQQADAKADGSLVLIGEAVTMGSLSAALRLQYGIQAQVICPLEIWRGLLGDCDFHTEGEEDLEHLLCTLDGKQPVVAADPLYLPILPEHVRFVPLSHEAFSGRCFRRDRKCLIGERAEALEAIAEALQRSNS
jgi:hypothetical protein